MNSDQDNLQSALLKFNGGGKWFTWKSVDSDGNKIPNDQRMTYANIKVLKAGVSIPSEADVNAKIKEAKDTKTAAETKKASAKTKLKALGLDDAELKTLGL